MPDGRRFVSVAALSGFAALAFAIYFPVLEFGFLHWDDGTYVARNPHIAAFDAAFVRWALTTTYFSYWHPLTWLSHGFDYAVWGPDAGGHHLVNVLLYVVEAFGVFLLTVSVLRAAFRERDGSAGTTRLETLGAGFVAALLFVVHPQHVEVVAWVSERKELLATIFTLGSVLAWLRYGADAGRHWLFASFGLFVLALMSKPMAVTLPVVLLVLDHYPLDRLTRANALRVVFLEKAPFFLASVAIGFLTIGSQSDAGAIQALPFDLRLLNAFNNAVLYVAHWLWPFGLSAFYPFPDHVLMFGWRSLLPVAVFIAITAFVIARYRAGRRAWLATWAVYLVTLSPVIGLLHSGPQAAAERYAHLTTIGFFVLFAAGLLRAWRRAAPRSREIMVAGLVLVIAMLAVTSHRQVYDWESDLSLWQSVANRFPGRSALVHTNFGNALFEAGRHDEARAQYLAALDAPGGHDAAYRNLYAVMRTTRQTVQARDVFTRLGEREPASAVPLQILGEMHEAEGDAVAAEAYYREALRVDPAHAEGHFRLANLALAAGDAQRAVDALQAALAIAPDFVDAALLLARIYVAGNRPDLALARLRQAYDADPTHAPAYHAFADGLEAAGFPEDAELVLAQARRLRSYEPAPAGSP